MILTLGSGPALLRTRLSVTIFCVFLFKRNMSTSKFTDFWFLLIKIIYENLQQSLISEVLFCGSIAQKKTYPRIMCILGSSIFPFWISNTSQHTTRCHNVVDTGTWLWWTYDSINCLHFDKDANQRCQKSALLVNAEASTSCCGGIKKEGNSNRNIKGQNIKIFVLNQTCKISFAKISLLNYLLVTELYLYYFVITNRAEFKVTLYYWYDWKIVDGAERRAYHLFVYFRLTKINEVLFQVKADSLSEAAGLQVGSSNRYFVIFSFDYSFSFFSG